LADSIRKKNVKAIFVTHAIKATSADRTADRLAFLGMLFFYPKANEEVLIRFNLETNRIILECAQEKGFSVIDAAKQLNNRRELFDDLVHFNKEGAEMMARLISDHLAQIEVAKQE